MTPPFVAIICERIALMFDAAYAMLSYLGVTQLPEWRLREGLDYKLHCYSSDSG